MSTFIGRVAIQQSIQQYIPKYTFVSPGLNVYASHAGVELVAESACLTTEEAAKLAAHLLAAVAEVKKMNGQ